jgi:hypothetical protein
MRLDQSIDQPPAHGGHLERILLRRIPKILFGRATGGIGCRNSALTGAETRQEPGVRLPARNGDEPWFAAARHTQLYKAQLPLAGIHPIFHPTLPPATSGALKISGPLSGGPLRGIGEGNYLRIH